MYIVQQLAIYSTGDWPHEETSAFFCNTCIMIAESAKQMHWSDAHHVRERSREVTN